ncbi:hypothetical protein JGH11_12615 [Dysgonomonas sp. Marseille-P4677]|uniref:LIC_10190 family membrane protein n=1 Tax=Dysgonomonas sp. Marseille-P4677 TaxID=2364790 RepID=UPI001913335F|nr:hypothetical protein [Dysgonomonas sp. Marseille-P4677]MBK5721714.1 hypothetical protein [Dysgonomonas sp. Marseille-P4677]
MIEDVKSNYKGLSRLHLIIYIIPLISLIVAITWQVGVFDSLLYHQQNIRWNEEYAIVPGLGNLEHRFGFNSNYLLLSAIFSFRFLFGEAVYSIQVLVLALIICWTIKEIIQSGYEIRRILLLIIITCYIFTFGYSLTATSTDAIPNIVSFYLIAKLLLYTNSLKKDKLFWVLIPISLLSFKLTIIPISLLSLYILATLIREKKYLSSFFLALIPSSIIILWLIRNVIISGYLIFPFYEIDLFSVDWKIPRFVAVEERDFILSCGIRIFNDILTELSNFQFNGNGIRQWLMNLIFIAPTILSPFIVLYCLVKKKYLSKTIYLAYIVLILTIGVWYIGGPDPRFIGGTLFAMLYYISFLTLSTYKEKLFPKAGLIFITAFALIMGYWAISRSIKFYNMFDLKTPKANSRPVSNILIRQYPYRELLKSATIYNDRFDTYKFENGNIIYISKSPEIPNGRFVCFESPFPCTVLKADELGKYQDISTIEPRGSTLQYGFRPK